jgi:signal transduction histidine kinase
MPYEVEILIVEDSPTQALQLQFILEEHGYRTTLVSSGEGALAYLAEQQPALVISAVVLPGIDGYQLCKQIKMNEAFRHIPVILLTSLSKPRDKIKGIAAGADNFALKFTDWNTLLDHISSELAEPQVETKPETDVFFVETQPAPGPANRAASEFLANMSHELRTPLNAILGFSQIMARSPAMPSEHRQNLNIIMRSGENLLTLINNILELSRIEAGRTAKDETNFDLHQFLDDLAEMFRLKAEDKGLSLIFDSPATLPRFIYADEIKLRQILSNLLTNALKFTDQGSISVRVRNEKPEIENGNLEAVSQSKIQNPKSKIHFMVEDTGPGIAPDRLNTIFEAFSQSHSGKKTGEGTGLGLPISQQLVRLMGGEISLSSEVGQGTRLNFYIQASLGEAGATEGSQSARHVVALAPHESSYRILIADDSPTNRFLLTQILGPLQFEVREATNGQEAIEVWESWEPHLIFMDMRMPILDGYEAARRIKTTSNGQTTAIVALTASALEEERDIVLAAGCDDFLRKPFQESALFETLAKYLGVQYIYEDEVEGGSGAGQEALGNLDLPAALATLPEELLVTLEQATIRLNIELIAQVIEKIRLRHQPLAKALMALANDFDFDEILAILQKVRG